MAAAAAAGYDAEGIAFHVEQRSFDTLPGSIDYRGDVSRETVDRLITLEGLVREEAAQHNLVSASSLESFHHRHIVDSLQLLPFLTGGSILDIGSGAGFPGVVLACAVSTPITLVEPRKKRAAFLQAVSETLALHHVEVVCERIERVRSPSIGTITARAVASLGRLFEMASHLATDGTRWVLPKGRTAADELADARRTWQGRFELVASRTDPEASIVIAERVRRI